MNDKKENGVRDDWVLVGRAITDVSRGYCLVLHGRCGHCLVLYENCVTWALSDVTWALSDDTRGLFDVILERAPSDVTRKLLQHGHRLMLHENCYMDTV